MLSFGGIICKIIGAVYKIPLANILGPEGMGVYQLAYPVYAFFLVFVSGGIPYALSASIAKARANNSCHKIMSYFYYSFVYALILAIIFFVVLFSFGNQLANLQGNQNATLSYFVLAVTMLFSCLLPCFRGLFQGYENYIPTFFSQLIEQVLKLLLGLVLCSILIKQSIELGVVGAFLGILFGEFISFVYLLIVFIKKRKKYILVKVVDKKIGLDFLKYSFAFCLTGLVVPFLSLYQSFLSIPLLRLFGLSQTVSTTVYGIQTGMVNSIINFPTVLSTSLAIVLLPSLSYYFEQNKSVASVTLSNTFKTMFVFAVPCAVGIFVLSEQIMQIVFPNLTQSLLNLASTLLKISSLNILFLILAQVSIIALQSVKMQMRAFVHMLIFACAYMISFPIFVISYNIYGLALAQLLSYGILCVLNIFTLKKYVNFNLGFKQLLMPFIASFIMGFFTYYIAYFLKNYSLYLSVIISVLFSVIIYFSILIIFKVFRLKDIKTMLKTQ